MRTIFEENIKKIAPNLTKKKYEILFEVCEKLLKKYVIDDIKKIVLSDRIEELEEMEVDMLADEYHVDFYDKELSVEEKRKLVKTSLEVHSKKGTRGAVQQILDMFFEEAIILEWFEDNSRSGTFKIQIYDINSDYTQIKRINKMINSTKRTSQHLDVLEFSKSDKGFLGHYFGVNLNISNRVDKVVYREHQIQKGKYILPSISINYGESANKRGDKK